MKEDIVLIHRDDVPRLKRNGSVVRNSYFWALRAIAGRSRHDGDWEFESEVWIALQRMLTAFAESGYLGFSETQLCFPSDALIPDVLRPVSTWRDGEDLSTNQS